MVFLKAKEPWRYPKTGVYWCPDCCSENLRAFAKGGPGEPEYEYRRFPHTKDNRLANLALLDAAPIYLALSVN